MCCQTGKLTFLGLIEQFVGRHGVERCFWLGMKVFLYAEFARQLSVFDSFKRTLNSLFSAHGIDESESSVELGGTPADLEGLKLGYTPPLFLLLFTQIMHSFIHI